MNDDTTVPSWLFVRQDLTIDEKWLYICLLHYGADKIPRMTTLAPLAKRTGLGVQTLDILLRMDLTNAGLVEVTTILNAKPALYSIRLLPVSAEFEHGKTP